VIAKAARALAPGGSFLFTAPAQAITWLDALTGQRSTSLGAPAYRRILEQVGLTAPQEFEDAGDNHYYVASRRHHDT
jgi:hypothetical protein